MNDRIIRLLLIENDPGDADLVREMLSEDKSFSFQLECADRLATGLNRLAQGGIDIVLLDLNLPDSTGLDTFVKVHIQFPQVAVVILTGSYLDEQWALAAIEEGAQDYLEKSEVKGKTLARVLFYAVERQREEEQSRQTCTDLELRIKELTAELACVNEALHKALAELRQQPGSS